MYLGKCVALLALGRLGASLLANLFGDHAADGASRPGKDIHV